MTKKYKIIHPIFIYNILSIFNHNSNINFSRFTKRILYLKYFSNTSFVVHVRNLSGDSISLYKVNEGSQ